MWYYFSKYVLGLHIYYYYYYYYYTIWMSLVTGLFFPVLLLNQRWSPPLRLQASHCSTFRIICDVPSIAVFCSESIECFPGTASRFFLRLHVTIPVAPVITGIIVHFRFLIIISIIMYYLREAESHRLCLCVCLCVIYKFIIKTTLERALSIFVSFTSYS